MIVKLPQRDADDRFYWVNPAMVVKLSPMNGMRTHDWATGTKLDEPVNVLGTEVELLTPYGPERLEVRGTPDEVVRMLESLPPAKTPLMDQLREAGLLMQREMDNANAPLSKLGTLRRLVDSERSANLRGVFGGEVREAREWLLDRLEMILGGSNG